MVPVTSVGLTQEQQDLSAAVGDFAAKRSPESQVRKLMSSDTGLDRAAWAEMAAMGLTGLLIPTRYGGSGAGFVELGLVAEQMGRVLLCAPYLSTAVLTPNLLLALGDDAECADVLPAIAAGRLIASVAYAEGSSALLNETPTTRAVSTASGWEVSGRKTFVLDAVAADRFYVQAATDDDVAVFAVERNAAGAEVIALDTVDTTRKMGRLTLRDAPARRVESSDANQALSRAIDCAAISLVGQQSGGASRVMQMAADYAKTRFQFGRAIGSFQAIKHLCADMLLEAESAVSAARHIAAAADADSPEFASDLALTQGYCSDAFLFTAATNIQVHGGIGFTWEHPAHLYLRRARGDAQLLGSPRWHRERYIRLREALS